jgi:hypothetical protein
MSRVPLYMHRVAGWEITLQGVEANAAELQYLELQRTELEHIEGQFKDLLAQQGVLTASKQETTKQLQELFRRGETVVNFLRTGVRQHYGKDSEKLIEFGLQPFRGRTRVPKPLPPESPATPDSISAPETAK